MKKTIIGLLVFLAITIFLSSLIFDKSEDISLIEVEGWSLWEGLSANANCNYNQNFKKECISDWVFDNDSYVLVYTNSSVDLKTRDMDKVIEYGNNKVNNPLIYDTIEIFFDYGETDFSTKEEDTDILKRRYLEIEDKKHMYVRTKKSDNFDMAFFQIPIGSGSIMMIRTISKELSDDTVLNTFKSFTFK